MDLLKIASLINGEIVGDKGIEITGVAGIPDAKEGDITFLSDNRYIKELKKSRASAVIVRQFIGDIEMPQIIVKNPLYAFSILLKSFYQKPHSYKGLNERAFISDEAIIGKEVTVYPFAFISARVEIGSNTVIYPNVFIGEDCIIGENCLIYPNVVIREGVVIGNNVIIHSGAVIGSDGFGYVFENGIHNKIPQVGNVIIEDDVEIGANTAIDRATTGSTIIGKGSKIDNLVQIGHNVKIGKNVILVAQVGIGGSSEVGDGTILGGQVGVADHTTIEAGTMIGAKGGAMGEMKRDIYSGILPMQHREWLKAMAIFAKLPELNKRLKEVEDKIKLLQKD